MCHVDTFVHYQEYCFGEVVLDPLPAVSLFYVRIDSVWKWWYTTDAWIDNKYETMCKLVTTSLNTILQVARAGVGVYNDQCKVDGISCCDKNRIHALIFNDNVP